MVVLSRAASLGPLTAWLLSNGAKMNGCEIQWLGGAMGAGLIAIDDLPAGAAACSVPRKLLLSSSSGLSDPDIGELLEALSPFLEDDANLYDASQGLISLQLLYAAAQVQRGEPTRWEAYVKSLVGVEVNSPVLWPRPLRNSLLAGTSLLADARELRGNTAQEFRRIRSALRSSGEGAWLAKLGGRAGGAGFGVRVSGAWLAKLGLDPSAAPCPLSGGATSGAERWLLAQSLVRSRAYFVLGDEDGMDLHGALDELGGDELVLSPLLDMANHDDALRICVCWGDGDKQPSDDLVLRTEFPVPAGEPVPSTYGRHSRSSSLLAFGFSTPTQLPTVSYRLAPRSTDACARAKLAVLAAADVLGPSGVATFEAPSDPPEVSGELLQTLRLLALPQEDATRLLDGCSFGDASGLHDGLGYPPILSASGVDVWASLSDPTSPGGIGKPRSPGDAWRVRGLSSTSGEEGKIAGGRMSIERAAYARLLHDCRSMARMLRAGEEEAASVVSSDGGVSAPLVAAASAAAALARQAEAEAIELLQKTAREEARKLPKELPSYQDGVRRGLA